MTAESDRQDNCQSSGRPDLAKSGRPERNRYGFFAALPASTRNLGRGAGWLLAASLFGSQAQAQQAAPALPQLSALLGPTLVELRSTIAGLRVPKWKAPGPVKDEAQGNASSIDRDLQNTLPGLLAESEAAPQSVADAFAVYRNLDALYEVLLRVSGTAELAAPDVEAANLAHSLLTLDAARRSLADSILVASHSQETALKQRQQAPPAAAPTVAAAPPTTVVNDGPTAAPAHRKAKAKPRATPPTASQP